MKKLLTFIFLFVVVIFNSEAQSDVKSYIINKSYHDKISSHIEIGDALLSSNEIDEGISYYIEAANIAISRTNDWYSSFLVQSNYIFDHIISYYYKKKDTVKAHYFFDKCLEAIERWERSALNENHFTEKEYWKYMCNNYSNYSTFAINHNDTLYQNKCNEYYIESCKYPEQRDGIYARILFMISDYYRNHKNYSKSFDYAYKEYKTLDSLNYPLSESLISLSITCNRLSFENSIYRRKNHTDKQKKDYIQGIEYWFSLLQEFYNKYSRDTLDMVLKQLSQTTSVEEEIDYFHTTSTLLSTHLKYFEALVVNDRCEDAIRYLKNIKDYLTSNNLIHYYPRICLNFANILETSEHFDYEILIYNELICNATDVINKEELYDLYLLMAGAYKRVGNYTKSYNLLTDITNTIPQTHQSYFNAKMLQESLLSEIGTNYKRFQILDELDSIICNTDRISISKNDQHSVYVHLADVHLSMGDTVNAEININKAIAIYSDMDKGNIKFPLMMFMTLGRLYYYKKDYVNALKCFEDVYTHCSWIDDKIAPLTYMIDIEGILGNYKKGRQYLQQAWNDCVEKYNNMEKYLDKKERYSFWYNKCDFHTSNGLIENHNPYYNDMYMDIILRSKIVSYNINKVKEFENYEITYDKIRDRLKEDDIVVEFLEFYSDDKQYIGALVLNKKWENPKFIKLCPVDIFLCNQINSHKLYKSYDIYESIWKKILVYTNKKSTIYFSPSTTLERINIESALIPKDEYLDNMYNICRLSSLAEIMNSKTSVIDKAILYGGLVYETDLLATNNELSNLDERYILSDSITRKGWSFLPNTIKEVEEINELFINNGAEVQCYKNDKGTEESFKLLSGKDYDVVHVATHGFYISENVDFSSFEAFSIQTKSKPEPNAGLLFSGGGNSWKNGYITDNSNDGILQSKEIELLNLSKVDLLMLSACETALGDYRDTGIYGLQRAFKNAGVNTIVTSLWKVDDVATSYFMINFYKHLLDGSSKREAFNTAKKLTREKYKDPYYWAAFIMLD